MSEKEPNNFSCQPDAHADGCPTCGDQALPAKILHIDRASNLARIEIGEREGEVALDLVDDVRVGDTVLVHLGFAIAKL